MSTMQTDTVMLLRYVNTQLRDHYESLEEFAKATMVDAKEIQEKLASINYEYRPERNQFC